MKRTYNVHKMFIYNIGIPKHKNTNDFLVQVRNFLLPLSLKVFRHKEREAQSFYADFSICTPHLSCAPCPRPRRASESHPSSSDGKTQLTDFFKSPQILRARFWCMTSFTSPGHTFYIWDFYFDICERHIFPARASTRVLKFAPN